MLLGVPLGIISGYVTTAIIVSFIDVNSIVNKASGDGLSIYKLVF